jgi:hypothetical protein
MEVPFFMCFNQTACLRRLGIFACVCLLALTWNTDLSAQRGGGRTILSNPTAIDPAQGEERMAAFRNQRLEGDFVFLFTLEQIPRRGQGRVYNGSMWGSWNEKGPITRIRIEPSDSNGDDNLGVEAILQNGPQPLAWVRALPDGVFRQLQGAELFEPILKGLHYRWFDLQMPFLYWDDFDYHGSARVNGRPAHRFLLYPPNALDLPESGFDRVQLALDSGYNALLRVDLLNVDQPVASLRVRRFREIRGQWIVREIDLVDERSRDRAQFSVQSAAVGVVLPSSVFDPAHAAAPPRLPHSLFENL